MRIIGRLASRQGGRLFLRRTDASARPRNVAVLQIGPAADVLEILVGQLPFDWSALAGVLVGILLVRHGTSSFMECGSETSLAKKPLRILGDDAAKSTCPR